MSDRPTIVTGASGFAGSHLLDRLATRMPLIAWHRPGKTPAPRPGVEWAPVDIMDGAAVADAIAATRPAAIYHLAGVPRVDTAWRDIVPHLQTNVRGTHHLLEAMRIAALPCRALVVSSAMVYEPQPQPIAETSPLRPGTPYGLSKLAQEQLALRAAGRDAPLDVLVARAFNHAGPRQDPGFAVPAFARQLALIEAGRAEPVIHVGNLNAERDLTDVRDVVSAYERLMTRGARGQAYNVCSGRAIRIGELLDRLISLSAARVRVAVDASRLRPADTALLVGDASRLRSETGWAPEWSIDDTLRDTLEWWRARVAAGHED